MSENREITSADGDLVGTLKIDDGVLIEFKYAKGSESIPFSLSEEDLAGVTSIGDAAFRGIKYFTLCYRNWTLAVTKHTKLN